jgi:hypothetical protein
VAVTPVDPPIGGSRRVPAPPPRHVAPPRPLGLDRRQAMGDAADGALAIVAVAGALVRYAVDTAARNGRALPHLPFTGPLPVARRLLGGPVTRALTHPATTAVRALAVVADELVPEVTRAVLARLDVPGLVREFVDIDRVAALLDVDAVVARADLDAVIDRVDIARVLDRVDLDAVVARVDLDGAVDRVDLDRAVDRVDVDRVISRTDLAGLARYVVQEIDLPGLLRASTGSVTNEMVRSVRDQGVDADRAVERIVDRLLHRQGRRTGTIEGGPDHDQR